MHKKKRFLPTFLVLLVISTIILVISFSGALGLVRGFFESGTVPVQRAVFGLTVWQNDSEDMKSLRTENLELASQVVDQDKNEKEIAALRAQFESSSPVSNDLLPVNIIGRSGGFLMIDKGKTDNIKKGDEVVFKNNLVGIIEKVSNHISSVKLITHEDISLTAETIDSKSIGIIRGQGVNLILDNVVLTDRLKENELVISRGDVDESGSGIRPGLIVGKIVSINRTESDLFQSAELESLVDFAKLEMVFVLNTDN